MTPEDIRQALDSAVGYFLALVVLKNVWEPLSIWVGRRVYRKVDEVLQDALPDHPFGEAEE